jgi:hypothetical protein
MLCMTVIFVYLDILGEKYLIYLQFEANTYHGYVRKYSHS